MKFVINGGKKLSGTIHVAGAKNAILPIIAATLLTDEPCVIDNVPRILDVETMIKILESIGSEVSWTKTNQLTICNRHVVQKALDQKLVKNLRASILFLGPLLARFNQVEFSEPGGCIIGSRPLDAHFQGLTELGVKVSRTQDHYKLKHAGLLGGHIILLEASVTATENILMAASRAKGETVIINAAAEPHVQDLAHFLAKMGVEISGIGTSTLRIQGVSRLKGTYHEIIPDTIEAGTFIILALATKSHVTVAGVEPRHLDVVLEKLRTMGAQVDIGKDFVKIKSKGILKSAKIDTRCYPGIPTDLQSLFGILATQTQGTSLIHETLFEGRLGYIQELLRMGASAVICDPHRALIEGPTPLYGQDIHSTDLRAGISLVIAGLIASGQTTIHDAHIIDRGYAQIEERLRGIGADIVRVE